MPTCPPKIQFNPSTLKVSYDTDTKKVQVAPFLSCGYCGENFTPCYLDVQLYLPVCSTGQCLRGVSAYYKWITITNPGGTYRIRQTSTSGCIWEGYFPMTNTRENYAYDDISCENLVNVAYYTLLYIKIVRGATNIFFTLAICTGIWPSCATQFLNYDLGIPTSGCMVKSSTSLLNLSCSFFHPYRSTGYVSITEINE